MIKLLSSSCFSTNLYWTSLCPSLLKLSTGSALKIKKDMTLVFKLFIVFGGHRQDKSKKQHNYKLAYGLLRRQHANQEETAVKRSATFTGVLESCLWDDLGFLAWRWRRDQIDIAVEEKVSQAERTMCPKAVRREGGKCLVCHLTEVLRVRGGGIRGLLGCRSWRAMEVFWCYSKYGENSWNGFQLGREI